MTALAFVDRYKAIRKQFYMPRPELVSEPKRVPVERKKYVYLFPIGPVMPAYWMTKDIGKSMAAAQEIIESQKVLSVPRNKGMQIIREVCIKYNITLEDLISERRHHAIVVPRQEAMYRLCTETDWSLPRIGRALGNRDHTTVLHGRKAYKRRLDAGEVVL